MDRGREYDIGRRVSWVRICTEHAIPTPYSYRVSHDPYHYRRSQFPRTRCIVDTAHLQANMARKRLAGAGPPRSTPGSLKPMDRTGRSRSVADTSVDYSLKPEGKPNRILVAVWRLLFKRYSPFVALVRVFHASSIFLPTSCHSTS
jgi:hypothetical protein